MSIDLRHGDCLEEMKLIPDKSIDLVLTDPPYFMPAQTTAGSRENPYKKTLADMSVIRAFFGNFFREVDRVLKDSGTIYVFCDSQSYPFVYQEMFPFVRYCRTIIWDRMTSYNGYTWRRGHEIIAWGEREKADRIPTGDSDVIRERGVLNKKRLHPVEKPINLIKRLIEKHGEGLVLDPFMGSGTTGVACKNLGRNFIGIELDEQYFKIAQERINNTPIKLIK